MHRSKVVRWEGKEEAAMILINNKPNKSDVNKNTSDVEEVLRRGCGRAKKGRTNV